MGEQVAERPGQTDVPCSVDRIFSPVEHLVQVERLLAGHMGDKAVQQKTCRHGDEVKFIGVDRTLDRIHLPDDIGGERRGCRRQEAAHLLHQVVVNKERVDRVRPVALQKDAGDREQHADDQAGECSGRGPETAVEAEDHYRAASPEPHHCHDRYEERDVIKLGHEQRSAEKEDSDADGNQPDRPDVLFRRERGFAQGQNDILRDGQRRTVDAGIVG